MKTQQNAPDFDKARQLVDWLLVSRSWPLALIRDAREAAHGVRSVLSEAEMELQRLRAHSAAMVKHV